MKQKLGILFSSIFWFTCYANPEILITGGLGYIGSHIAQILLENNFKVFIIDHAKYVPPILEKHPNCKIYRCDFSNTDILKNLFSNHDIYCVIHCASYVGVAESMVNPYEYYDNNVSKTLKLLGVMNECGIKKIIFSSSCSVYGNVVYDGVQTGPVSEVHPLQPESIYGNTKKICEDLIRTGGQIYGLKYVIFRFSNISGADFKQGLGPYNKNIKALIPTLIRTIRSRHRFILCGDDYPTKDGSCIRDFLSVKDVAQAHLQALDYLKNNDSLICNLGIGKGSSVKECIQAALNILGKNLNVAIGPRRDGDIQAIILDSSLAFSKLNWRPVNSSLTQMIEEIYNFYENLHD